MDFGHGPVWGRLRALRRGLSTEDIANRPLRDGDLQVEPSPAIGPKVRKATLASVLVKTLMDQRTIEPEAA
jgi:hypothetical protein